MVKYLKNKDLKGPVFTVSPEMELYVFTELSKGWISLKSGIFITLDGTKENTFSRFGMKLGK